MYSPAVNIAFNNFLKRSRFEGKTGTSLSYDVFIVQNILLKIDFVYNNNVHSAIEKIKYQ